MSGPFGCEDEVARQKVFGGMIAVTGVIAAIAVLAASEPVRRAPPHLDATAP